MASFDKRLALIDQTQASDARVSEAQTRAIQKSIEALGVQIGVVLAKVDTGSNDATTTVAGRALIASIEAVKEDTRDHRIRLNDLETLVDELRGGVKTMKALALVMGMLSSILSVIAFFQALHPPVGPP